MVGPLRAALWTLDTGGGSVSPAPDRTQGETGAPDARGSGGSDGGQQAGEVDLSDNERAIFRHPVKSMAENRSKSPGLARPRR